MSRARVNLAPAEYAILGLLHERPLHGYAIARHFAADLDLGLVCPQEMSNVYALLRDLQEQGLIVGERQQAGARPPRMVFHLTNEAEARLHSWLTEPVGRMREVRLDFLLKLYFCRRAGAQPAAALLDGQIAACEAYVARLDAAARSHPADAFEYLVAESKVTAARGVLAWLNEVRGRMGTVDGRGPADG